MLKVENISTGYGKKQVLFGVSFEVNQGDIVLLAGSNGSGKSTLLKAIYGMLPLWNGGQIFLNGENTTGESTYALLKKGMLYIPQKNNLFENLTIKENLEIAGLTIKGKNVLKKRIEKILSVFTTLKPHLRREPMKLSGGERQLLTLAMAALHEPKIILLDEPFAGLSPKTFNLMLHNLVLMNKLEKVILIIVEHRIKEILKIANKFIFLKLGSVALEKKILENTNNFEEYQQLYKF